MISGWVNAYRDAVVRLPVRNSEGREQAVEAVIDTGVNGYLDGGKTHIRALPLF